MYQRIAMPHVANKCAQGLLLLPLRCTHLDEYTHTIHVRHMMQARLSPDYVKRHVTPGSRSPGSSLTLLDPVDHQIRSGQIIRIRVPTKMGAPVHMAIGQNRADLPAAGVREEASRVADGTSTYAVCVTLMPDARCNASGCMSIRFEQSNSHQLMTSTAVTLHG